MRADISAAFALFVSVPMVLPLLGARAEVAAFSAAFVAVGYGGVRAWLAARRSPQRRVAWRAFAAAAALGALGSLATLAGGGSGFAYRLGALSVLGIIVGALALARGSLKALGPERTVDALLPSLAAAGILGWFVVRPGIEQGRLLLTAIFVLALIAAAAVSLSAAAWEGTVRRSSQAVLAGIALPIAVHGAVTAGAAGLSLAGSWITGLVWAASGITLAAAAGIETGEPARRADPAGGGDSGWVLTRLVLPLGAALVVPATVLGLHVAGSLTTGAAIYLAMLFALLLFVAFTRQSHLLAENHRAVMRERALREEMVRRNEDLEALTGLATTLSERLEEAPIVERGLGVLHLAARSRSAALHTLDPDGTPRLAATAGDWHGERPWAPDTPEARLRRGGRDMIRIQLVAREASVGHVTLVRRDDQEFHDDEIRLLRVLAGQLAIAIQNARDYRDKLEQAVRDPLTGLYNRRYFFEALDNEVRRSARYGSHASLVLFDVDDFKQVNDSLGHAAGDAALRAIAEIARGLIRDVDTFARIGGEEFALLLPETQQLDALLVAERIRTAIARAEVLPGRSVTVSGGLSSCPLDATDADALERMADGALYWAKGSGKNICALAGEATEHEPETDREDIVAHLQALVGTIDSERREHSERVAACSVAIARELGISGSRLAALRRAALLHDVGKVAVDSAILDKPGSLDEAELGSIRLHPGIGATMLAHAGLREEAAWVRAHHERYDGAGYPEGLAGEEIPIEARILFVAEAYESMTTGGPHREGATADEALAEIERCAGSQFDPRVADAMLRVAAVRTQG